MAGIVLKNENFQPLPPKTPKSEEKVSQVHDEGEEEVLITPESDQEIISANEINSQISHAEIMDYSQKSVYQNAKSAPKIMNHYDQ